MNNAVLIIDGNNIAYRAMVMPNLYASNGTRTAVIFSIFRSLITFLKKFNTSHFVFCWDISKSKRRTTFYPQYKMNRKKDWTVEQQMDYEHFISQMKICRKIFDFLNFSQVSVDGVESDDLMSILSCILSKKFKPIIITSDKDLLQCVSLSASVYNPSKKILYSAHNFIAEIGLAPEQYLFARAMMGDKSDNIAGIRGVGEKTAFEIIKLLKVPNLEFLSQYAFTNEKKKKIMKRIIEEINIVKRNMQLMRLPDGFDALDCNERPLVKSKVNRLLMKSILSNKRQVDRLRFTQLVDKLEMYSIFNNDNNLKILGLELI